ncbi:hypothetical protein OWM07_03155 [Deferribacter thermophilus]
MGHSNLETFFRRYAKYVKTYQTKSKISDLFNNQFVRIMSENENLKNITN